MVLILAYLIFLSPRVQTYFCQKIAKSISERAHTPVSIQGVDFSPFKKIILKGVYIEDHRKDTLIYVGELSSKLDSINFKSKKAYIGKLNLKQAYFNLYEGNDRVQNLQVFLDSLSNSPEIPDTTSQQNSWIINVSNLDLIDSHFRFLTIDAKKQAFGMNYDDIDVRNINLQARNIKIIGDSVDFDVKHMSCIEKSGFILTGFKTHSWITPTQWGMSDATISSPKSVLSASQILLNYVSGEGYWSHFTKKMKLDFQIRSSKISFEDLAYFNDVLLGYRESGFLSGHLFGTVYDLKGRNINVIYGNHTNFKGRFYLNGLPQIENSYLEANFEELTTSISDLENVYIPNYEGNHIVLPSQLDNLGLIHYKGKFNGFINDFVFYGNFKTDQGDIRTDILLKPNLIDNSLSFTGDINTQNFNLGHLLNHEKVGQVSMNVSLKGSTSKKGTQGVMNGNIKQFNFYNYEYKNLSLNGYFADKHFDGRISLLDPNIEFDFAGKIDFSKEIPVVNFDSHLKNAKLFPLHLNTKDELAELNLNLNANFTGNRFDNANGHIFINNIEYKNGRGKFNLNDIKIDSKTTPELKQFDLKSDLADLNVKGNYELDKLVSSLSNMIYYYLPAYAPDSSYTKLDSTNKFEIDLLVKENSGLTELIYPDIILAPNSQLSGEINAAEHALNLKLDIPFLTYDSKSIEGIKVNLNTNHDKLILKGRSDKLAFTEDYNIFNLSHQIEAQNNQLKYDLNWNNWGAKTYSGSLSAVGTVESKTMGSSPKWEIDLLPSTIILADSTWQINQSHIQIDSTSYSIDQFKISQNEQFLSIDGKISTLAKDIIKCQFNDISLKNINTINNSRNLGIDGKTRGYFQLSDFYGDRLTNADLVLDNLTFNNDTIGDLHLKSNWVKNEQKLSLEAYVIHKNKREINIQGSYYPVLDSINLSLNLDSMRMNILHPYLEGSISELEGRLGGFMQVEGPTSLPRIFGKLKFLNTSFKIDQLQTKYTCNDSVVFTPKEIQFNNFKFYDSENNMAEIYGAITLNDYNKFDLDLALSTNNFKLLNTKITDNELLYGQAYLTGITHLYGSPDDIEIEIDAKTSRDTRIYIPLNKTGDIENSDFITFINTVNTDETELEKYDIDLTGIKLNCNLEITPETDIQIIFDSKIGDVLKANGSGNLQLGIDTKGDFKIYGNYTIQTGSYLFTLQNVINKKFDLSNGGTIKWDGDPYSATIDINAIYNVKTTLYDILLNTPYVDNTKKIQVQCNMNLSQKLSNPNIHFDIAFPTLDQQTQSILAALFSTEDEMNKQILSLLVLNRFYTPEYMRSTDANFENKNSSYAVGVTTSELLSNQLSNWLSQISNKFDVGFSYRPGDNITSDEIEFALSTQLFNDKVTINGNLGTNSNQNQKQDNDIVGDFDVNIKLDKKGKLQMKAFTRSNEYLASDASRNTQGVGIFYKEDFDTISELFKKYMNFLRSNKKEKASE
ncbi:translocation/assembly module TamB [Ancylomarina salipaludis]|uniref:Translocation/assembly module TamB n=1 Tax=Ancylomarina salipaludis TaxID=2501299 RepID=A0A4Q1JRI9_9BACT|nr:translocation/assembly module TamB domain-containing protein [Ancylomarina salipaludis]RXQ97501.1 translocation/assembly module TamB [Ancylomarina salipaludis]